LLLVEAVALVFSQSAVPVEVAYAKATLHAGDRGFGLLLATWGAGAVLGSLIFARSLRRPLGTMLSAGTLAAGLAYVGFAAAPSLLLACLAALIGGIGNGVETPSLISIVQRLTPENLHGRMMGAVESLGALCIAIGLPLGGALVALSTPRVAFLVLGLVTAASSVALLRVSPRRLEPVAAEQAPASAADGDTPIPKSATAQTYVP
jgi:MFS family permease